MIFPVWRGVLLDRTAIVGKPQRSYRTCDLFAGSRDHLKMAQQLFQLVGAGGP